ncbi:MAG: ATP-binding cassette domain-containing protein [Synergistetes bacterium]|nr:ATP-binding cassette domain-containing protein [Synergistota bacterium]
MNTILRVDNLVKHFPIDKGIIFSKIVGYVRAVDGISFSIEQGETLGLVGESGSGKSTTGLLVIGLLNPTSGSIEFKGKELSKLTGEELKIFRQKAQIVFQDPFSSLNPRMIVKDIVGRPLKVHGLAKNDRDMEKKVLELLEEVGLKEEHLSRYPHEFSGGQRQRIAIARALICNPEFIVLDEPTSALDVSVQAQILNLLKKLQIDRKLSYLFISHDLSVIRHMSHKIAVMYLGKIVEYAPKKTLFENPLHPYTQALLKSIPKPAITRESVEEKIIRGDVPSPMNPPPGCRFHTRCPLAKEICGRKEPSLKRVSDGHLVACHMI